MSLAHEYVIRLHQCYRRATESRLVNHRETDIEALEHFQRICNDSSPKNDEEIAVKNIVRDMYFASKTDFLNTIVRVPHYIWLTDARQIVNHFGIHEITYLNYDNSKYSITTIRPERRKKFDRRHPRKSATMNKAATMTVTITETAPVIVTEPLVWADEAEKEQSST